MLHCKSVDMHHVLNTHFSVYKGRSSQTGTFNFTGIKRVASVVVLHTVVSGKCVLLLIGGARPFQTTTLEQ